MIKITIFKQNQLILGFECKGHAGYATLGKDIVCSAVTAIAVGGLNAVGSFYDNDPSKFEYRINEGDIALKIYHQVSDLKLQTILETLCIQFETVAKAQNKYVKIIKQEVHSQ